MAFNIIEIDNSTNNKKPFLDHKAGDQKISQEIPPSHRHAATYKGVGRVLFRGGSLALLMQYTHCNNEFLCSNICSKNNVVQKMN